MEWRSAPQAKPARWSKLLGAADHVPLTAAEYRDKRNKLLRIVREIDSKGHAA
jgi:hypothetical protein